MSAEGSCKKGGEGRERHVAEEWREESSGRGGKKYVEREGGAEWEKRERRGIT